MRISMIAAMTQNRVIGKNNDLPWHLPDDFKFFKEITKNHHVIMGRKNFESLPHKFRPLPDRTNIVLTRNQDYQAEGTIITNDLSDAIEIAKGNDEQEVFIIGGGEIYAMGLGLSHRIYLTEIYTEIEGDTFFPEFNKDVWIEASRSHHAQDERHAHSFDFVTYEKHGK